ncbi:PKD domain-containing protein [Ekhidna sp.]
MLAINCLPALAQDVDLEEVSKADPIKVSGSISALNRFYFASGIEDRQENYIWTLSGRLNFSIFGVAVPLSGTLTSQNSDFSQPYNRLSIKPSYKWAKAHIGYSNMTYSSYTLAGHTFLGGGVELNPGKLRFAANYGRFATAIPLDRPTNQPFVPSFNRIGYGGKIGYGDDSNYIDFMYFSAKDQMDSWETIPDSSSVKPSENLVLGTAWKVSKFKNLTFAGEFARSAFTTDVRDEAIGQNPLFSTFGFKTRASTAFRNAFKSSLSYRISNHTASGTYPIVLTATNAEGCSASQTQYYTIDKPTAVIDAPDTLCLDLSYRFSELTGGNATWDFTAATGVFVLNNNGEFEPITTTGQESVEVYFQQSGYQDVTLQLNSSCGNETITKSIFIQELNINPFLDKEYSCNNPEDVAFDVNTDAKDATYEWLFSDGTNATTKTTSFTYFNQSDTVEFGINEVNLDTTFIIITQPATATRGVCYDTALVDFEHYPLNVKVEPGTGFTNLCEGTTLTFTDSINVTTAINPSTGLPYDMVSSWRWQVYDDMNNQLHTQSGSGSSITGLSYNFPTAGDYNVYLEAATTTGCTDTSYALAVTIGEPLTGGVDFDFETFDISGTPDASFCLGDSVIYSVTDTDPRINAFHFYSDNNRIFHQPNDTTVRWKLGSELGIHDVTLEVEADGCISSFTKTNHLTINGAVSEITYASDCDYAYEFESTSTSYPSASPTLLWEFRDDGSTAATTTVNHDYSPSGSCDYWVILTADDAGCTADKDSVLVTPRLTVADVVIKNTVACGGNEIILDASGTTDARSCRGLTFRFPTFEDFQRPITTFNTDTVAVTIPDFDELPVATHYFQLISTDDNGCKDTVDTAPINTSFIQVGADLSDTTITCKGIELTFSDTTQSSSTTLVDWEWHIWSGDLSLVDTIKGGPTLDTIDFVFNEEPVDVDSFFVSLQVTGSDGCVGGVEDTLFVLPYVYLNSRIIAGPDNDNLCAGDLAEFRGRDNRNQDLQFGWDFGNLDTDTTLNSSDFAQTTYATGADYTVSMYYFQPATGCVDTLTTIVEVESAPDIGFETNVDALPAICAGEIIQFTDTSLVTTGSITSINWDLDNGEVGDVSPYSTIFDKGSYDVTLEASTDNGCSNSYTRTLVIVGPEGGINVDDDSVCPDDTVAFNVDNPIDVDSVVWFFGDGLVDSSNVLSVDHQYLGNNIPASYAVTATFVLYSSDGCELAADTTINFYQVEAGFDVLNENGVIDSLFCVDEPITFSDNTVNADIFNWDFGSGDASTDASPSFSYASQGSYVVQQIVENALWGCVDTLSSSITIEGLPDTGLELNNDTICFGETLTASLTLVNDSSTYSWSPTGETGSSISFDPQNTFTLSLTETNYAGCVSSLDSLITVIQPYAFSDWTQPFKKARVPDFQSFYWIVPTILSCLHWMVLAALIVVIPLFLL